MTTTAQPEPVRCCVCGRVLRDELSVLYGIGPDCRAGLSPADLAYLAEAACR